MCKIGKLESLPMIASYVLSYSELMVSFERLVVILCESIRVQKSIDILGSIIIASLATIHR